ncbi:MAG: hypothetical protein ACFB10_19125 [Salibacteraceae bacterium]
MSKPNPAAMHLGIAEQGKILALKGDHNEALRHYREALRISMDQRAGDVFFQHYAQCVMESLELAGQYEEVVRYCRMMHDFLDQQPEGVAAVQRHRAHVWEREAVQHLLLKDPEAALECLKAAQQLLGRGKQPLTDQLLGWVQRGLRVTQRQIEQAQRNSSYFVVRQGKVRPELAIALPKTAGPF